MKVKIIIQYEKINDPALKEGMRRLVNVLGDGDGIIAECQHPELLGKLWGLPNWIHVILRKDVESVVGVFRYV